ncbi:substrate-binding domain-containing protein [Zoogloea sp. LCSB751]|uniref:substrate-binding domain-containing protein n=1 Tax=Zoogloea sp. LCSB751 TaxID=1965277 RepID=UPI0009A4F770|nr:substrate-binding domain-containing protein [Zoogloea sp. LCSB751]
MAYGVLKFLRSAVLGLAALAPAAQAGETIVVASTTSTEQSGLFNFILPIFEKHSGIAVKVVALGTGQALDVGRRGDADVVLVHDRPAEDKFVADGYGVERKDVMYNDFVLVGPMADAAGVKGAKDATDAFARIARKGSPWVSRGDRSGTHAAELRFWQSAGVDPKGQGWYKEAGSGMGPTLNMAAGMGAYTLADRGTWASFRNRQDLAILYAGDPKLYNPYGVMLVNPAKHPHIKKAAGERFIAWLTSAEGRRAISAYRIGNEQLFYPLPK